MDSKIYQKLDQGTRRLVDWQYSRSGGFIKHLFLLIALADDDNRELIRKGFSLEVEAYENYAHKDGWWNSLCKQLKIKP